MNLFPATSSHIQTDGRDYLIMMYCSTGASSTIASRKVLFCREWQVNIIALNISNKNVEDFHIANTSEFITLPSSTSTIYQKSTTINAPTYDTTTLTFTFKCWTNLNPRAMQVSVKAPKVSRNTLIFITLTPDESE